MMKKTLTAVLALLALVTPLCANDALHVLHAVNTKWQALHPNHGDHFWNRAVYHVGNMAAYHATGEARYADYSTAWSERNIWWGSRGTDPSRWKYSYGEGPDYVLFGDNQICFQVYADLYNLDATPDPNKIARAREVMEYEMNTDNEDYIWWVDGLFMVMPVMTKLYHITGNSLYLEKMYRYWRYATELMCDDADGDAEATGLYFRDAKYLYPAHTTNSGQKDFWARGNGWIFAAFAKVLEELPADDPHRDEYLSVYRRMAVSVRACQQAEGYWTRSMLDPDFAPGRETSGTALLAYGYASGIRQGLLSREEYGETLHKAWTFLSDVAFQPDSTVGYIQPIGERAIPGQTVSATSYYDFGVGAFLLAAAEVQALEPYRNEAVRLRLTAADADRDHRLVLSFNVAPRTAEAANPAHYSIDGQPLTGATLKIDGSTVVIQLEAPLSYGTHEVSVHNLYTTQGAELAAQHTLAFRRAAPLTPAAEGLVVTASDAQEGNPESHVLDSRFDTRWSSQGKGQWIQLDLGQTTWVQAVDLSFYQGDARTAYLCIQVAGEDGTFTEVLPQAVSSGRTTQLERFELPQAVQVRYVRVVCNGTSAGNWNSITEMRVVTLPADPTPARPAVAGVARRAGFDLSGRIATSRTRLQVFQGGKRIR